MIFIRLEIGEIVRYYLTKIKKTLAASQTVATARIAPKICQDHSFFCPVEYFHNSPEAMLRFGRIISRLIY